jgi:filamentous hemagglutinin
MLRKPVALFLVVLSANYPVLAQAAAPRIPGFYGNIPRPAVTALPSRTGALPQGVKGIATDSANNRMTVTQDQSRVVIDWNTFNIGADAWVRFDQKGNKDWAALNIIRDANPTQIYGKLTADGKVYLINQNGILFGPGSRVNVNTLAASSLNIKPEDFIQGINQFRADAGSTPGAVSNHGAIQAGIDPETGKLTNPGAVFLIGPTVENNGTIDAPYGQVGLVAGTSVMLAPDQNSETSGRWALVARVQESPGQAWNMAEGRLTADGGMVGMYGGTVQQDGMIRSITAIKRNGQIELMASDRIVTGAGSITATPVSDSTDTVNSASEFRKGSIVLSGLNSSTATVSRVELNGAISAPGGNVQVAAAERVYLGDGSSIDVSGVWNDKEAMDSTVTSQYTSVVLRDAFQQKDGTVKGASVTVDPLSGASFGDVSDSLSSRDVTARERSTAGGTITISALNGDIIGRSGSLLDFSGGGTRYGTGTVATTKLVSGNRVYDISNAPQNIAYDRVLGSYRLTSKKYGVVSDFTGLYYGGSSRLNDFARNFTEGSNAGSLTLRARSLTLDGQLNGNVTKGFYQTLAAEPVDKFGRQTASGLREPAGGTLVIGQQPGGDDISSDLVTRRVVVAAGTAPLAPDFTADSPVNAEKTTILSAEALNAAGLSNLQIYANTSISTEPGANIDLRAGASLKAEARRIEHLGSINAPAGTVTLTARDNMTSYQQGNPDYAFDAPYNSKVFLGESSTISVAGERVDNTLAARGAGAPIAFGHVNGGTIEIKDKSSSDLQGQSMGAQGLVIDRVADLDKKGAVLDVKEAVLDVSGGYQVNPNGSITGGDAGAISLQGSTLIANGDFRGQALPGRKGGTVTLQAANVEVAASVPASPPAGFRTVDPLPAALKDRLVVADNRFDDTGMTTINLKSANDLAVDDGVTLTPSRRKMELPSAVKEHLTSQTVDNFYATAGGRVGSDGTVSLDAVGASAIGLAAGQSLDGSNSQLEPTNGNARVSVSAGATVQAAPEGQIALTAPGIVMNGILDAPAGSIGLTSGSFDLQVGTGARVSAAGFNLPVSTSVGTGIAAGYAPKNGGTVTLAANNGNVVLASGSVVDVSGSQPVAVRVANGDSIPATVTAAGDPGSVTISSLGNFTGSRSLKAESFLEGRPGGTLNVTRSSRTDGLTLTADSLAAYQSAGFDALSFKSNRALNLSGAIGTAEQPLQVARSLTLDAPEVVGNGGNQFNIASPWIRLANSSDCQPVATPAAGAASLSLSGRYLDVDGDVALSGFREVKLEAAQDIRLGDREYQTPKRFWSGRLATAGDLTLKAERIYPNMSQSSLADSNGNVQPIAIPSDFIITSGGRVTTLPAGDTPYDGPVYSAGGSLTINATGGIEHNGALLAPMGKITLNSADNRVYLAAGSVLSTAGSTSVNYGFVDADGFLRTVDKSDAPDAKGVKVESAPQKSVTINGKEIVVRDGATIDIAGGGSVTAYKSEPGIEGSVNPLIVKGRYVIVPGDQYSVPGAALYLDGGDGLAAGVYSILPASYAFLPGAMVVTDLGTAALGKNGVAGDGSPVVTGYATVTGTGVTTGLRRYYSVRAAEDVLKEGNFTTRSYVAGNAGNVALNGTTTILNGSIVAAPLQDPDAVYDGGTVVFGGKNIILQTTSASLPDSFSFTSAIAPEMAGTLQVAAASLSGKGFKEVSLGTLDASNPANSTASVTVTSGSVLETAAITLAARDAVTIGENARLSAATERSYDSEGHLTGASGGKVSIVSKGKVDVAAGAEVEVYAGGEMNLEAKQLDLRGKLVAKQLGQKTNAQGEKVTLVKGGKGTLNVTSDRVILGADAPQSDGLALTGGMLRNLDGSSEDGNGQMKVDPGQMAGFDRVGLKSRTDLLVRGNVGLAVADTLSIDAARISADAAQPVVAEFSARRIELRNSGAPAGNGGSGSSSLTFRATGEQDKDGKVVVPGEIVVAGGEMRLNGFGTAVLDSRDDLVFKGKGALRTDGDLTLRNSRITTSYNWNDATGYEAADFAVEAGGKLAVRAGTGVNGNTSTLGGRLALAGKTIEQTGTIDVGAGQVRLTATAGGPDAGIILGDGAQIKALGHDYGNGETERGGLVTLRADNGIVRVDSGATVDVSAAGNGDAGNIVLASAGQGVTIDGHIRGASESGRGGAVSIDTRQVTDFAKLNGSIASGGFTEGVAVRARTGDLTVDGATTVQARHVTLTADSGNLNLQGKVDASGASGGSVVLNAGKDLTVGGAIDAHATGADGAGGSVALNSEGGRLSLAAGSTFDVSGNGAGGGGSADLRAQRSANDVAMDLNGTVKGASRISAEAFVTHSASSIGAAEQTTWQSETDTYMANAAAIESRLLAGIGKDGWSDGQFHFLPGIEVRSIGDLSLNTAWDLSGWRPGGEAGNLTLRAAGNLNINQNLVDHPTGSSGLTGATGSSSWGINLVAGSDHGSADPLAVLAKGSLPVANGVTTGNLAVADNTLVYTESAPLRFASANDTTLGNGYRSGYMINSLLTYTLGTYSGAISGKTGGDLVIRGGTVQSATGDMGIDVGGDLNLANLLNLGSIRTTGYHAPNGTTFGQYSLRYAEYQGGGDIRLDVAGAVKGNTNGSWDVVSKYKGDTAYSWSPLYGGSTSQDATRGLATMGGGNLEIRSGGDFFCQAGTLGSGTGNLKIHAGGNLSGRFLVHNGDGVLHAGGNFGMDSTGKVTANGAGQVVEAFGARLSVVAQGSARLGTVYNPSIARTAGASFLWRPGYTPESSLRVTAVTGDITLSGANPFTDPVTRLSLPDSEKWRERILPGTVEFTAGRDIRLTNDFALAPSGAGNLKLVAENDIVGAYRNDLGKNISSVFSMSDADPAVFYNGTTQMTKSDFFDAQIHRNPGNQRDNTTITIHAGRDLADVNLFLPKQAEVSAGRDIRDINYVGQNLGADDLSQVRAGRNIVFSSASAEGAVATGIEQGGAGSLLVQAGGDIDLGTSKGIKTSGNAFNPSLDSKGSTIVVVAGSNHDVTPEQVGLFFNGSHHIVTNPDGTETEIVDVMGLRDYGVVYSHFKASGQMDLASQVLAVEENAATELLYGHPVVTLVPGPGGSSKAGANLKIGANSVVNGSNGSGDTGTPASQPAVITDLTIGKFFYPSAVISSVMTAPTGITTTVENDPRLKDKVNDGIGAINMTSSQISTNSGKDDIYILSRSSLNVGKSTMILDRQLAAQQQKNTGIYTSKGGAINIFSGGDLNVNESRVMTFYGGDITAWSDQGNINAGRGSKTTISTDPPKLVEVKPAVTDPNDPTKILVPAQYELVFSPPAVGSGIRALTYAAGLNDTAPPAGDGYVSAPRGNIDAGEAGIAVKNLFLEARQVFNTLNIKVSGSSSGLAAPDSTVSIGAISGAGALAESSKMIEQTASLGGGMGRSVLDAAQTVDDFVAKWLDVKVISFDDE